MTRAVSRAFPPGPPLESNTPSEDRVLDRPASRSRRGHHRDRFTSCKHAASGLPWHLNKTPCLAETHHALRRAFPHCCGCALEGCPLYRSRGDLRSRSFVPPSRAFALDSHASQHAPRIASSLGWPLSIHSKLCFEAGRLQGFAPPTSPRRQPPLPANHRPFLSWVFMLPFEVYLPPSAGLLPKKLPDPAPWPKPGCVCPVGGLAASPKRCNNLPGDFRRQRTADELGFVGSLPKK
jgi:hypothetical protein